MAKQLYIDENGNPIEVSGTINTAELLPISGNDPTDTKSYIDNIADYSTSEKAVGTWIDGKTIYQKTISLGLLPNNTSSTVPHGITGLTRVIEFVGNGYDSGNAIRTPLPFVGSNFIAVAVIGNDIQITTNSDRSNLVGYLTLKYLKS